MSNLDEAPNAAAFARWVKSRRIAKLLTQDQLAERAGLSVRTVRNLEAGRIGSRLLTRRLIIAALSGSEPDDAELDGSVAITAKRRRQRRPRRH